MKFLILFLEINFLLYGAFPLDPKPAILATIVLQVKNRWLKFCFRAY